MNLLILSHLESLAMIVARILVVAIFLLNAFGIIDQSMPAQEMKNRGLPAALVPLMMIAGRILEFAAGAALALGILPQFAALALFAFIVPATFISHSFWLSFKQPNFESQFVNFFKNVTTWGALIFIAAVPNQPVLIHFHF